MSGVTKKLISASGGVAGGFTAIEDVFSTYLRTSNGTTATVVNGVDYANEGGLVWTKNRSGQWHVLYDTERGGTYSLTSNNTNAQATNTAGAVTFNADGYSITPGYAENNASGASYVDWTFRKAPRFFDVVTWTGDGSASRDISHNLNTTVGTIIVKRYNTTEDWVVFHRSLGANNQLKLNQTAAAGALSGLFISTPTDTVFTVGSNSAINASGSTYVAYLFAHDPLGPSEDGSDGLIDCGSFSTPVGSGFASVELGWEPQFVLWKSTSSTGNWVLADEMRGTPVTGGARGLFPNVSNAEDDNGRVISRATGFDINAFNTNTNHIYIAIRRGPMRAPESGTEVFATNYTNAAEGTAFTTGFVSDMHWANYSEGDGNNVTVFDRLRGMSSISGTVGSNRTLITGTTGAESTIFGVGYFTGSNNTGWVQGPYAAGFDSSRYDFRRAPEFFDVVAYTGNGTAGRTVPHNLGVAPEMMIVKERSGANNWNVFLGPLSSEGDVRFARLNRTDAAISDTTNTFSSFFYDTLPTSAVFTIGDASQINKSGDTYIAYLFATLAGVSKVGSYTGNGSSQTINCGFTTGARFILIKRSDFSGEDNHWYVWDTARGIVAGNDPFFRPNVFAGADVTTDDSIDPDSSGFIVNQTAVTDVNVNAASYIFYAVA